MATAGLHTRTCRPAQQSLVTRHRSRDAELPGAAGDPPRICASADLQICVPDEVVEAGASRPEEDEAIGAKGAGVPDCTGPGGCEGPRGQMKGTSTAGIMRKQPCRGSSTLCSRFARAARLPPLQPCCCNREAGAHRHQTRHSPRTPPACPTCKEDQNKITGIGSEFSVA